MYKARSKKHTKKSLMAKWAKDTQLALHILRFHIQPTTDRKYSEKKIVTLLPARTV